MLDAFNAAPAGEVRAQLRACCAATAWIEAMVAGRPYPDEAALAAASDAATAALDDTGLGQALAGHPRIGERAAGAWSRREQSGMAAADADVRTAIAAANAEYEQRFGHVYLVCATGRDAAELLAICRARLGNSAETERGVVLGELAAINRLRLAKLLHPEETR
ncbi:MAG TPA: 2-oxo-4-hydroxy-4-carboxy-5-ureidoimidazoline decarboxylase [Pseudonocardiaceae bacterium]|nr:2-oxo-4-hydroxy-4-carboxy-5-ureidoimidazoline decarboxylase [Pseudonocardiaceae bacterium]